MNWENGGREYNDTVGDWYNQLPLWKQLAFSIISLGGPLDFLAFGLLGYYRWRDSRGK